MNTLDTPRLRLRMHRPEDLEAFCAIWADPRVVQFIGGRPFTQEETWSRILRYIGHWHVFGYGFWAIEERSTGAVVGDCGFADFRRVMNPGVAPPEAGWALGFMAQGKGYATEAMQAALAWVDRNLGDVSIRCIIAPDNAPSLGVAGKCGFVEVARSDYRGEPIIILERPAGAPEATMGQQP